MSFAVFIPAKVHQMAAAPLAVVFPHGAPLALGEVGAPFEPGLVVLVVVGEAQIFFGDMVCFHLKFDFCIDEDWEIFPGMVLLLFLKINSVGHGRANNEIQYLTAKVTLG
jgi:hypothetical protein